MSFGQVVCVGIYQMDGEEPWSCRTCRALHTYILVITALLWSTRQSANNKSSHHVWIKWTHAVCVVRSLSQSMTHPAALWTPAAGPWWSLWRTAGGVLSAPRWRLPLPAKTTEPRCFHLCSVSDGCWSSSLQDQSFPVHRWSTGREGESLEWAWRHSWIIINGFISTFSIHLVIVVCTSSSLWSKGLRRCCGMSSVNPFCRARNWASIPRINLQLT